MRWRFPGKAALVGAAFFVPAPLAALELGAPVDCSAVGGCYIQSLPDRDPGPGAVDHRCGSLTYDGHNGTDFRVRTLADLAAGVPVLAAAPGVVRAIRDGEPDTGAQGAREGRECGNGVVIRHEDGWETQYCHLAKGSVAVAAGDRVPRGHPLGQMGLSGKTEFPHLHIVVRKDGEVIDPFDAERLSDTCGPAQTTLWSDPAPYRPGGIVDTGFSDERPDLATIRAGAMAQAAADPDILFLWVRFYGVREGDELSVGIFDAAGQKRAWLDRVMDRNRAEQFYFVGVRRPEQGWPPGIWTGGGILKRDGEDYDVKVSNITF